MFHTVAACTSAAFLLSLYREKNASRSKLSQALRQAAQKDPETASKGLVTISNTLDEEKRMRKGVSVIAVQNSLGTIVSKLKFVENSENEVAMSALRLVRKVCAEPEGRHAFYRARGYRAVLQSLSEAHKHGHVRLMEEAANTLEEITAIDVSQIVLPPDVPFGSEGAAELAGFSATTKMLRTLDPNSRVSYLEPVTRALSNIAALMKGTKALQKGTDGQPGVYYFLRLISHSNESVACNSIRAVRFLSNHGSSQHEVICEEENVKHIAMLLHGSMEVLMNTMKMIHNMIYSPLANKFFTQFAAEDGLHHLFRVWTKGNDKVCRDTADALIHMLEKLPATASAIRKLMDVNRADIHERRAKDEEMKRRQMEAMRNQQMMIRQRMMSEMMGGGGGGDMMDMMMGDE